MVLGVPILKHFRVIMVPWIDEEHKFYFLQYFVFHFLYFFRLQK